MADGRFTRRDLRQLPVFDTTHASCDSCELRGQRDKNLVAFAYRPEKFCGVMLVGEGPGQQEVAKGRPFVGPSGKLLRDIVRSVGADMDECYITNATCCRPPPKKEALHKAYPNAIPSCLPRLEAEIAAVRPRVIITLGAPAFIAISSYDKPKHVQEKFTCDNCDPETRKVGPVLQCSSRKPNPADGGATSVACGALHFLSAATIDDVDPDEMRTVRERGCEMCGAKMSRQRPKFVKCPVCGGRKTRTVERYLFTHDFNLGEVAGAVFEPGYPDQPLAQNQLDPWLREQGVRYIIPTLHPAFLMRDQQFAAKSVQKHLRRGFELADRDMRWTEDYGVTTDPAVVRDFGLSWRTRGEPPPNFAVDTETEAIVHNPNGEDVVLDARQVRNVTKIRCIGFATTERALVVDTRGVNPEGDDPLLDAIQDVLESGARLTFHNGMYDVPVIDRVWGIAWQNLAPCYTDDTLGAHANLYPDEPHDLSYATHEMTEAPAWKPPRRVRGALVHKDFEQLALYNARDCLATARVREACGVDGGVALERQRMDRAGLSRVYAVDSRLRHLALEMTMRGLPLDRELWRAASKTANDKLNAARTQLHTLLKQTAYPEPEAFNPHAYAHVAAALYDDHGFRLPVLARTKTGPSTEADTLRQLVDNKEIPELSREFIHALLSYREHHKIKATYVDSVSMQPWADGRLHPIWKPWGTKTGRLSSSPNAQNWPKWLRGVVVAPEGRKFVSADEDQLELRIMAALSGDAELIRKCATADATRKLEPEYDPHSFVASFAFGAQYTELALEDPEHRGKAELLAAGQSKCRCGTCRRKALRDLIKRVIYGLNYGAGEQTILDAIYSTGDYVGPTITVSMVAHVKRTFFKLFPGVERYQQRVLRQSREQGEVRSPLHGRRRIFPLGEVPMTEVYNYPIQSGAADIMNQQSLLFLDRLGGVDPSAFPIAQVHDALYVECAEDRAPAVAQLLEDCLTVQLVLAEGAPPMPFTAGAEIHDSWAA